MISACIGFKDRDERLLTATIDSVIAEGVDDVRLCNFGKMPLKITRPNLYHIHIPLDRWRLGLAFVICSMSAPGDVLLLINGGIVLSHGIIENSLPLIIPGEQFVSSATHYLRCTKLTTDEFLKTGDLKCLKKDAVVYDGPTGNGDFYMIARADYSRIGGHDPEMQGWGRENVCFHRRAIDALGFKRALGQGEIFHLYDGFAGTRKGEQDYKINDKLLNTKRNWWRNDKR